MVADLLRQSVGNIQRINTFFRFHSRKPVPDMLPESVQLFARHIRQSAEAHLADNLG